MKALILNKTQNTAIQFIRYLFVGGFAALVDTGTLYLLHSRVGLNYLLAAAVGFILGLVTNYLISIAWVFESSGRMREEFALFTIIGLGGLALTEAILWLGASVFHAPVMAAKILALAVVLAWNFGMRKKFVFSPQQFPQAQSAA